MNEHRRFAHYVEPWELTTLNGCGVAVSLGEVDGNAVIGELAYLAVERGGTAASTLLTVDELTAVIDQLTIVRNGMRGDS